MRLIVSVGGQKYFVQIDVSESEDSTISSVFPAIQQQILSPLFQCDLSFYLRVGDVCLLPTQRLSILREDDVIGVHFHSDTLKKRKHKKNRRQREAARRTQEQTVKRLRIDDQLECLDSQASIS